MTDIVAFLAYFPRYILCRRTTYNYSDAVDEMQMHTKWCGVARTSIKDMNHYHYLIGEGLISQALSQCLLLKIERVLPTDMTTIPAKRTHNNYDQLEYTADQ